MTCKLLTGSSSKTQMESTECIHDSNLEDCNVDSFMDQTEVVNSLGDVHPFTTKPEEHKCSQVDDMDKCAREKNCTDKNLRDASNVNNFVHNSDDNEKERCEIENKFHNQNDDEEGRTDDLLPKNNGNCIGIESSANTNDESAEIDEKDICYDKIGTVDGCDGIKDQYRGNKADIFSPEEVRSDAIENISIKLVYGNEMWPMQSNEAEQNKVSSEDRPKCISNNNKEKNVPNEPVASTEATVLQKQSQQNFNSKSDTEHTLGETSDNQTQMEGNYATESEAQNEFDEANHNPRQLQINNSEESDMQSALRDPADDLKSDPSTLLSAATDNHHEMQQNYDRDIKMQTATSTIAHTENQSQKIFTNEGKSKTPMNEATDDHNESKHIRNMESAMHTVFSETAATSNWAQQKLSTESEMLTSSSEVTGTLHQAELNIRMESESQTTLNGAFKNLSQSPKNSNEKSVMQTVLIKDRDDQMNETRSEHYQRQENYIVESETSRTVSKDTDQQDITQENSIKLEAESALSPAKNMITEQQSSTKCDEQEKVNIKNAVPDLIIIPSEAKIEHETTGPPEIISTQDSGIPDVQPKVEDRKTSDNLDRITDSSAIHSDTAPLPAAPRQVTPASPTTQRQETATEPISIKPSERTGLEPVSVKPTENTGLVKNPMADLNGHAGAALSRSFTDLPATIQTLQQRDKEELQKLRRESHVLRQELQQCKDTIQKLQQREKILKERLSEQAQKQLKVSSKFEDLNLGDKRPTQLIRHYGNLYSEARLDAYDALDDLPEIKDFDDLKGKLLFSVIVLAFRSVSQCLCKLQTQLKQLLCVQEEEEEDLPPHAASQELQDAVSSYLMKCVDTHDLSTNMEEVSGQVFSTLFDYPSLKQCSGLKQYIEDCVRIAWALSVQRPSYLIKYDSPLFDDLIHTRFHASDPDSNVIKMVMWPSLLEGIDGPCVFKGVVLT